MGRRSRRRDQDTSVLAPDAFSPPRTLTPRVVQVRPVADLRPVEDRRTYHPLGPMRPPKTWSGHSVTPVKPKFSNKKFQRNLPFGLQFAAPKETLVCVRRKRRKEVLHALKKTGKGAGRRRKPRRNFYSWIGC